jgi:hypothetical protein
VNRWILRAIVPLAAALLLDRYCKLSAKRTQRSQSATDLTRWEGEGGAVAPTSPPSAA